MYGRLAPHLLPARISEKVFTIDRGIDVDFDSLNYKVHVPTLNEEEYIEDTLKSLARQEPIQNGDVELIVIDSYSGDSTKEIADRYADMVVTAPKGKLTARNKGIKLADADVILSADAGDIYPKGWIAEHAKAFEDPSIVATHGPVYSKSQLRKRWTKVKHSAVSLYNLPGNNSAVRVSAIEQLGNFNEDINQQQLFQMILEEQIFKKAELLTVGAVRFRPFAGMLKSDRRNMLSEDRSDKYDNERAKGDRF